MAAFHRLLLTGAAGALGRVLRTRMAAHCEVLRLSDREPLVAEGPHEEVATVALEDADAMLDLLDGVDAVLHFGGISVEAAWGPILQANIIGLYNLYEAARKKGVKRIVFASSNHVVGFYKQNEVIDALAPPRPDGLYGVSKAFGEDLSRMYFERHGIETICVRIGSATVQPENRRMLASWLSHDDLERLILASLHAINPGHSIVFGCSDNAVRWWDNTRAAHLGYRPQDNAEAHRARIEAEQPNPDPTDPVLVYQGGAFVRLGPFE
jgi:uronate dehydrogenase